MRLGITAAVRLRAGRRSPSGAPDGSRVLFADDLVPAPEPISARQIFARFWPRTKPYRKFLWCGLAFVVVGQLLDAAGIWLFKLLVDEVLTPRDFGPFPRIATWYVLVTLGIGTTSFLSRYLSVWVGERFLTELRTDLYRHVQDLSLDFFERRRLGDVLSRLTSDVSAIEALILSGVVSTLGYALRIVIYSGVLFYLQWQLATVCFLVAPVFWLISRGFSRRIKQASRENRRNSAALSSVAEEGLANVSLIQAYNRQRDEVERFRRQNLASMRSQLRSTRLRGMYGPISDLAELVALLIVIGFGVWLLTRGRLTLGELLVFLAYFAQLASPLRGVGSLSTSLSAASASAERIVELFELKPSVRDLPRARRLTPVHGVVALSGVSFRYPDTTADVLHEVDFTVQRGETLAVVGASGAGKSTIAKLLLRFYDPSSGCVTLDGHDLRSLELADMRRHLALVMQETLVFDGSIRDNILWGAPQAGDAAFAAALQAADLDEFIGRLPDGVDTRLGQRGRRLSGGQRQRVAIARALLRDSPVLVLDEPTTGLDPATAERVLAPLRGLMRGRTTIIISHDLRAIRDADTILVLEHGREAERGSHVELLRRNGVYAELNRLDAVAP